MRKDGELSERQDFFQVKCPNPKCRGIKKGEKVQRLGECVCLHNYPEILGDIILYPWRSPVIRRRISKELLSPVDGRNLEDSMRLSGWLPETVREGFPELSPVEFVEMFCREMGTRKKPVTPYTVINRIEFSRVIV